MVDVVMIMETLKNQDKKLDKIGEAITQMAVQDNEIKNINAQLANLWTKTDHIFDHDGPLHRLTVIQGKMIERQDSCKVHSLSKQVMALWAAIITMSLTLIGKALGE
jgi:uncharacterized coiled-coil protein SlyX